MTVLDRRDWIAGLEKGLSIIEAFDAEHDRMTSSQVGQRCGLTRTAARRHLLTLTHLGYAQTDGKLYWLSPRALRLGQAYLESARLPRAVQPYLQRVTAGTGETAYAGVLDRQEIVYIARSGPQRALNIGYVLGSRVQAHVTAAGLLLLSLLPPPLLAQWLAAAPLRAFSSHTITDLAALHQAMALARHQGWYLSEQQLEVNYRGIAVPIFDHADTLLGAMSVTMPINSESSEQAVRRVLPVLQETARSMRQLL